MHLSRNPAPQIEFLSRLFILAFLWLTSSATLQLGWSQNRPDRLEQARLRGSITPERAWWNLKHYALDIHVDIDQKTLTGTNSVRFEVLDSAQRMQIDLQPPMQIDAVTFGDQSLNFRRFGNVYYIEFPRPLAKDDIHEITIAYSGKPRESRNPPWSGGVTWAEDNRGRPFIATTCQGIGASIWWPCKDHGYDEPDEGVSIAITVPDNLVAVANGRLVDTQHDESAGTKRFNWVVTNPINNYCVNMNIGKYVSFSEKYEGEFGELDMEYWVLDYELEKAKVHFKEAPRTIEAFEYWFGKYPFYEDSYKLVSVPYSGMEHQSSVTYGNGFRNGYRGRDVSGTGVGMKFDFIIVHETGHEWFGNNISMKDTADMWIHESFTNYSENLFVEYHFSQEEAEDYVIGSRRNIRNDRPIIGQYDLNQRGSDDMYYKGGNVLHTLRHVINDDVRWREILRGLNSTFWHQTVTTQQIENYISQQSGIDLQLFFDQYLRTIKIPKFEYQIDGNHVSYRFDQVVEGFSMPIRVAINDATVTLQANQHVQVHEHSETVESLVVDRNFYVETAAVDSLSTPQDILEPGKQIAKSFKTSDKGQIEYLVYAPSDYQTDGDKQPLMLFLHGRGESYGPLELVKKWGPPRLVERGEELPFLIVSPQCPPDGFWSNETQQQRLIELLDYIVKTHNVDEDRIYLSGLSMGGFGVWTLAAKQPDRFAAINPICGRGVIVTAERIKHLPVWVFHGDQDEIVPIEYSEKMVQALREAGNEQVIYTVLENIGHNSWSAAYASSDLYNWMLGHKRKSHDQDD